MEGELLAQFLAALKFAPYAAVAGAAIALLDFLSTWVQQQQKQESLQKQKSLLGFHYKGMEAITGFCVWTIGAGIGGFVGILAQILQETVIAAITVAVTWPLILSKVTDFVQNREPDQKDMANIYLREGPNGR